MAYSTHVNDSSVELSTLSTYGVPNGALNWFYTLKPAISFSNAYREQNVSSHSLLVIAWDKPVKRCTHNSAAKVVPKKVYGVYLDHASFWQELNKLPENERFAYEVICSKQQCRAYWDIEFVLSDCSDEQEVSRDIHQIMSYWIAELKQKVFQLFSIQSKVCVLDGTRKYEETKMKVSFHVIITNVYFENNNSKAFQTLRGLVPSLYDVSNCEALRELKYKPSQHDTGAPDLSVWKENQIFRILTCSKRGGSTPLDFAADNLTDTTEALDSFLTFCDPIIPVINDNYLGIDVQASENVKRKRKRADASQTQQKRQKYDEEDTHTQDSHDIVQYMLHTYPAEMASIHECVQNLLMDWGHLHTKVDKLVRANVNLRYQCINIQNRSCIFTREIHVSNTPIIWLDALHNTNEGELSEAYLVIYNCKSSECMCHGIIGEVRFDVNTRTYSYRKICPAIIQSENGPIASAIDPTKAVMAHELRSTSDNEEQEEESQTFQSEAIRQHQVNPIYDKIIGYAWSFEEIHKYGSQLTYRAVKQKYEKMICKICRPHVLFLSFQTHAQPGCVPEFHHYTYDNMAKNLKNVFYLKKNDPLESPVPARFFSAWTDDPSSRTYERIQFDPSPDNRFTGKGDLNVWPGMCIDSVKPFEETNDDPTVSIDTLVEPILHHIFHVIADRNKEHTEWILDWMANIIQRPHMKTQVPIVISGKQGVGKGIIFDFFREHILGFGISAQIQNATQDLFSRFANKHVHKIFLQIDEGEGLAKFADQLKNLITADQINYEIKGIQPMTAPNFINIVITTNHEKPVLVETSDRRYVLFKASDVYIRDEDYYFNLGQQLKRKEVARAFYEYLKMRDLSKYAVSFQRSRPMTEYYIQSRKASIPVLQRFLSALINSKRFIASSDAEKVECTMAVLFREFSRFQEIGKFQSNMTQTTFCTKLKSMPGVTKKSKFGSPIYELDYVHMKKQLSDNHEYDEDILIES